MVSIQQSGLIFGFISILCQLCPVHAQLESGFSKANECRHVAVSSAKPNDTSLARCSIPTKTSYLPTFSLRSVIPKDWFWVLDHQGSITGQTIFYREKSLAIISQKECLDSGKSTGRPGRTVHPDVTSGEGVRFAADFLQRSGNGDAYWDCAFSQAKWQDFRIRQNGTNQTSPLLNNTHQLVRRHIGGHTGLGDFLLDFDFTYDSESIEVEFRRGLELVLATSKMNRNTDSFDRVESKKPILQRTYPFETGLSVLALDTNRLKRGSPVKPFHRELSSSAWNQLLKSIVSFSSQYSPAVELPEKIRQESILPLTVVTILSIVILGAALSKLRTAKCEQIGNWPSKPENAPWVVINSHKQFKQMSQYSSHVRNESLESCATFFGVLAAIVAGILEFHNSNLRPQQFLIIQQGGIITYGIQQAELSDDKQNNLAGTPFTIAHYLVAQVESVGNFSLYFCVILFYFLLFVSLCLVLHSFACRKEHHLSPNWVRVPLSSLRIIVQSVIWLLSLLNHFLPRKRRKLVETYYDKYQYYVITLCKARHVRIPETETCKTCNIKGQIETQYRRNSEADENHESEEKKEERLSVDDIDKAAIVLASDECGRLSYVQAFALMADVELAAAIALCRSHDCLPSDEHIRRLAMIYYMKSVVIPGSSEQISSWQEIDENNLKEIFFNAEDNKSLLRKIKITQMEFEVGIWLGVSVHTSHRLSSPIRYVLLSNINGINVV